MAEGNEQCQNHARALKASAQMLLCYKILCSHPIVKTNHMAHSVTSLGREGVLLSQRDIENHMAISDYIYIILEGRNKWKQ